MSIINDALKKTQTNMEKKDGKEISKLYDKLHTPAPPPKIPPGPTTKNPDSKPSPKKKEWYQNILIIICMLCLITGMLGAVLFFLTQKSSLLSTQKFTPHAKPAPKRTYKQGEIVLSGTMMMSDHRVALINDQIYEVGDMINDKELVDITLDKIELKDKNTGESFILNVRNKQAIKEEKKTPPPSP